MKKQLLLMFLMLLPMVASAHDIEVKNVDGISVYTADGKLAGTAVSHNNVATIATNIQPSSIAIVKVGDKSVKVLMK